MLLSSNEKKDSKGISELVLRSSSSKGFHWKHITHTGSPLEVYHIGLLEVLCFASLDFSVVLVVTTLEILYVFTQIYIFLPGDFISL